MADYNWQDHRDSTLALRFPDWAIGRDAWQAQSAEDEIKAFGFIGEVPLPERPRLFISYKSQDASVAIKVSRIAKAEGFDIWLDILDPRLQAPAGSPTKLSQEDRALLIAGIIEMALLNCSHIVAVMTRNTPASRWVPYEYGRVKDRGVLSNQASAYLSGTSAEDLPEYMYLGDIHKDDNEFRKWLQYQSIAWAVRKGLEPIRKSIASMRF